MDVMGCCSSGLGGMMTIWWLCSVRDGIGEDLCGFVCLGLLVAVSTNGAMMMPKFVLGPTRA